MYGDGAQTRSFCYGDDLIRGIVAMVDSSGPGPINPGNPAEFTVGDFAKLAVGLFSEGQSHSDTCGALTGAQNERSA